MQKANREEVKSNRQHSGSRIVVVKVKNDAWRRFGLSATAAAFFNPNGRWLLARGGLPAVSWALGGYPQPGGGTHPPIPRGESSGKC